MSKVLIRRLANEKADVKYLRGRADAQENVHGLFFFREYTGLWEMERIRKLDEALSVLKKYPVALYHLAADEFFCEYTVSNWEGYDVTVRVKVKIDLGGKGFAGWMRDSAEAWDGAEISAETLERLVMGESRFGLASYVRNNLAEANPELLKANGVGSWPWGGTVKLREPWLSVADVEDVRCVSHSTAPKVTEIRKEIEIRRGTVLNGQYDLLERCGRGGMGQVWKARDIKLDKIVAVKVLNANVDEQLADSIKGEAATLSELNHTNVIGMRGYHEDGNVSYMVMDFIDGSSLEDFLGRNGGRLDWEGVATWLKPIAEAIDYVHREKKRVHRDIKPSNIMIGKTSRDDTADRSILCDFGIACEDRNVTQCAWGTESYRAPEVRSGVEVSFAADVYSFSVTLFRCLTGGLDFPDDLSSETAHRIGVPPVVLRGMSKDPLSRPKNCAAFFKAEAVSASARVTDAPSVADDGESLSSLPNGVVLPVKVMDAYRYLLGKCGKADVLSRMKPLLNVERKRNERIGWRISDTVAFVEVISEITVSSLGGIDDMKHMGAEDRRGEILAYFGNHHQNEFDSATRTALHAIYRSIADTSEEEWK